MTPTRAHGTEPMPSYARGWYLVAWSTDLVRGASKPLGYFGRQFVLYRSDDGRPVLLDAYCPHLGAHLGHGGKVTGDSITCPFHAWRFGPSGKCAEVPYATRVPPRAQVRAYPLREHSGMILGYFDFEQPDREPDFEVPELEELGDAVWTPLEKAEMTIATQPREVIENIADVAHFLPVHRTKLDDFEVIIDGPRATQRSTGRGRNLEGKKIPVESVATYHGPAVQFTRLAWAFPMVLINAHIPIDEKRLLLRFGVSLRTVPGVTLTQEIIDAHVASARNGYFEDVAIWENKCWRDTPVLADGDGPILKVRRWYASFFTRPTLREPATAATAMNDERA